MKKPTIKEIAQRAGVSRGTVDRALNGRGGINKDVENRILEIAKQLKYKPNIAARALATAKKSMKIGVIINSDGNPFYDKVLDGIKMAIAETAQFYVEVVVKKLAGYDISEQIQAIDAMISNEVSAIVITAINHDKVREKLNNLAVHNIELVTLNSDAAGIERLCFVGCDYLKSGKTAGELISLIVPRGSKVGVVTGSHIMLGHTQRIDGFRQVLYEANADKRIEIADIREVFDDEQRAYEQTKAMLLNNKDITALYFCAGGINGGMKAVEELYPSGELTVITVDDTENVVRYMEKGLVTLTVCQQPFKQGYDAVKVAFTKLIEGKNPPRKHLYTENEVKTRYHF